MSKEFKVLVRPIYSREEFKEETIILEKIDSISWQGKEENKTKVFFFKTSRGEVAFNSNSNYRIGDKTRYFSIYQKYVDNMEYEFEEDFTKEDL